MTHDKSSHFKLVGTMTLGPKGQVVIPANVRECMEIKPGDTLVALYIPHKQAVAFIPEARMQTVIDEMGKSIEELRSTLPSEQ